jgi:hypothetical protein
LRLRNRGRCLSHVKACCQLRCRCAHCRDLRLHRCPPLDRTDCSVCLLHLRRCRYSVFIIQPIRRTIRTPRPQDSHPDYASASEVRSARCAVQAHVLRAQHPSQLPHTPRRNVFAPNVRAGRAEYLIVRATASCSDCHYHLAHKLVHVLPRGEFTQSKFVNP